VPPQRKVFSFSYSVTSFQSAAKTAFSVLTSFMCFFL
jgi:hypothetical protein